MATRNVSDGEGPECPSCGAVWTADDPAYYDTSKPLRMKCTCGAELHIEAEITTSWTTTVVSLQNDPDQTRRDK